MERLQESCPVAGSYFVQLAEPFCVDLQGLAKALTSKLVALKNTLTVKQLTLCIAPGAGTRRVVVGSASLLPVASYYPQEDVTACYCTVASPSQ